MNCKYMFGLRSKVCEGGLCVVGKFMNNLVFIGYFKGSSPKPDIKTKHEKYFFGDSSPRPDIKMKYEKYFFGDFLSADFCQKL